MLAALNAEVQSLHRAANPAFFREVSVERAEPWFRTMLAKAGVRAWIVEADARPIGYALAILRERSETPFTVTARSLEVDQIAVLDAYRQRGGARQLMACVRTFAVHQAIPQVTLKTWAFNRAARHAFERLGMQEEVLQFAVPSRDVVPTPADTTPTGAVYHRLGEPGGPGCDVATLPVQATSPTGAPEPGTLLDAGTQASEVQLLRTIAHTLGVQWGEDSLGWWAVVPRRLTPS